MAIDPDEADAALARQDESDRRAVDRAENEGMIARRA